METWTSTERASRHPRKGTNWEEGAEWKIKIRLTFNYFMRENDPTSVKKHQQQKSILDSTTSNFIWDWRWLFIQTSFRQLSIRLDIPIVVLWMQEYHVGGTHCQVGCEDAYQNKEHNIHGFFLQEIENEIKWAGERNLLRNKKIFHVYTSWRCQSGESWSTTLGIIGKNIYKNLNTGIEKSLCCSWWRAVQSWKQ